MITKEGEAELRGHTQFIEATASRHASELLGCWFAVRNEYEPLIRALGMLLKRTADCADVTNNNNNKPQSTTATEEGPGK